jgi:hypothetical protein
MRPVLATSMVNSRVPSTACVSPILRLLAVNRPLGSTNGRCTACTMVTVCGGDTNGLLPS